MGGIGDFIRNSDGLGGSDSERQSNYPRQNYNGRENENRVRDNLRHIASSTLEVLDDGEYFPPGHDGPYDLKTKTLWTDENTRFYGPDAGEGGEISESEFIKIKEEGSNEEKGEKEGEREKNGNTDVGEEANDASYLNETNQGENELKKATAAAASKPHNDDIANPEDRDNVSPDSPKKVTHDNTQTTIYVGDYSTLVGARRVHFSLARKTDPSVNKKIGVLNFASAKKRGGGFMNGSQAQVRFLKLACFSYMLLT